MQQHLEKALKEALQVGNVGLLAIEDHICPVTILSVTDSHIRVTNPKGYIQQLAIGLFVSLELCSQQGCLVIQTEIIEIPSSTDEGILLGLPSVPTNVFLRQFWRVPVNLNAQIKPQAHPRKLNVVVKNISSGGLLLETTEPFEVGETLDISLTLPDPIRNQHKTLTLLGSVQHVTVCDKKVRLSLKFIGMDPSDQQQINEFVSHILRTTCPQLNIA